VDAGTAESLLDLAERAGPGLTGLDRKAVLAELEGRYDDLLAAMQWFVDEGRSDDAVRVARSLAPFWTATGRLDEGSEWFSRALGTFGGEGINRGRGCFEAGLLAFWKGDDEVAAAYHREALEIGRGIGDPTVTALALTGLARIALRSSDVPEARTLCREAVAVTQGTTDRRGRSSAIHVLGVAAQMTGDLVEARALMTERMELAREEGNYLGVASEAANLSTVERQLGDLDQADALGREALGIARQRQDEWMFPYVLNGLAAIALERGELERAATLIGAAEAMMVTQDAAWPPDERPHYERTLAKLADTMGPLQFEQARAEGQSLAPRDAIDFALNSD